MPSDEQVRAASRWKSLLAPKSAILTLGAIIGAIIAVWTLGAWVVGQVRSWEAKSPKAEYRRLRSLSPGIQLTVFSNRMGIEPQVCSGRGRVKSCTYVKTI
jgi:hypothetical protein